MTRSRCSTLRHTHSTLLRNSTAHWWVAPPDWTITLPRSFLLRDIRQTTLTDALSIAESQFVKHSVSKAFPAAVYTAETLAGATAKLLANSLVHVGEPVLFDVEYRCFVIDRRIVTISPYLRFGEALEDHSSKLGSTPTEMDAARSFAETVLVSDDVQCPPAFVLDVGLIADRGWAVVEFNECWASGIYACDPQQVLETLLRACVPTGSIEADWDFRKHYLNGVSLDRRSCTTASAAKAILARLRLSFTGARVRLVLGCSTFSASVRGGVGNATRWAVEIE